MTAIDQDAIFVCYASADAELMEELAKMLAPLCQRLGAGLFFDRKIEAGALWHDRIIAAIDRARVGLLLLSPDFFVADFIAQTELPRLLERKNRGEMLLLPIPLRACLSEYSQLGELQAVWSIDKPYASLSDTEKNVDCRALAKDIERGLKRHEAKPATGFRVLLLATEQDLGAAQRKVSGYLTQLGMEVAHEVGASLDMYDQVVLLQAWRWQGRALIQVWEQAPAEKRSLFLVSETSDWPHKYVEMPAYGEIQDFHEAHKSGAQRFEKAEDLATQVGEQLDAIRRARQPAQSQEAGLSEAERAYLKFNLPAWRSGRNQLSRGQTKTGAYETNRIYNERLYVAMDGLSQRFGRNDKGEIVAVPVEGTDRRRVANVEEAKKPPLEQRLPLADWVAARALRWLVVSGSPGAGKTVFLTRVAAQLAAQLLGEEIGADPGLEALRPKSGLGPIPVVLEARLLAEHGAGPSGVAEALRQVLASADTVPLPHREQLARQLRQGRFLLLVDALDEVGTEQQRRDLVDQLKGLAALCPMGRLLLTTRSARYTGIMPFGPEFEIVELMPFSPDQVARFCRQYREDQIEVPGFERDLTAAIGQLEARERGQAGESFSGNALMLTTLCWLYKRDRRLPDDRVSLCSRLVDGLCEARSQAGPDGRIMSSDEKRKHLAQLALAMQQAGAQSYGHGACLEVIAASQPSDAGLERTRHERLLRCLVEQTGLMYYEANARGEEQLRFAHRLLREYLVALCLCFEDRTMDMLVADLARDGHLTDPLWLDVVRMLPGVANSCEKAATYAAALLSRARSMGADGARLWGTLAATIQENSELYKSYDVNGFTREALARYEAEGARWPREARFMLLEGIGRWGDPRLDWRREDYWIRFEPGSFIMGDKEAGEKVRQARVNAPFSLAKYPVTHGEYQLFIDDHGYDNPAFWSPAGRAWLNASPKNKQPENEVGFCQSNQPRVGVSYFEAEAYCAWLGAQQRIEQPGIRELPYLPSEVEWEYAARGQFGRPYPWGRESITEEHANYDGGIGRTSPVGAYPRGNTPEGLCDMGGNVREWTSTLYGPTGAYRVLRGGSWFYDGRYVRSADRDRNEPGYRNVNTGFRLARGQAPLKQKKIERRSD